MYQEKLLLNNAEGKWLWVYMLLSFSQLSVKDVKDWAFEDMTIITVGIIKPIAFKTEMNFHFPAYKLG